MDELVAALRRERAVRLLIPLFFVSGATGLVYQTIWARSLQLVFGTSQFAIATVLSAFMAGLAVGGLLMAKYAGSIRKPLAAYGVLEVVIGGYALVFPWLLELATPVYLWLHRSLDLGPLAFGGAQLVVVGALLLVPTSCMGATLPLLARFVTTRLASAGDRVGLLYGVNTAGAVLGIWMAGFYLLPSLGLAATTWCAAGANLVLGVVALAWSRSRGEGDDGLVAEPDQRAAPHPARVPALLVAALAGFSSLVYEVSWFRLMTLILGASTYAFSTMLLAFLVGIASGGWLGGRPADRVLDRWGPAGPWWGLAALQAGVGCLSYAMMFAYQKLPFAFLKLFDYTEDGSLLWPMKLVLAVVIMAPPAVLMGATFPFLVRAALGRQDGLERSVGHVYGANTFGAILGAAAAGFLLLPVLHVVGTVRVAVAVNLLGALVCGLVASRALRARVGVLVSVAAAGLVVALVRPPWHPLLMTAAMYKYASEMENRTEEALWSYAVDGYRLLFYEEGLSTVVTVAQDKGTGNIWLANNGKVDASTTVDMPTQVMVTHLPMLLHDAPEETVVIGLASGITLGAAVLHPSLTDIEVVELEPDIERASHFFDDFNHRPLEDERVTLFANDGRNHLMLQPAARYDVVVSEPSNPWISGVSNLFTREYWEMGKERLKPGGVWGQWIQLYGMDDADLRSLLRTFCEVFPHVALFSTIEDADVVLVGSEDPLKLTVAHLEAALADRPLVVDELGVVDIHSVYELLARFQLDRDAILEFTGDEGLNTDDNMRVEYGAPLQLHKWTGQDNLMALLGYSTVPLGATDDPRELLELARAYGANDERGKGLVVLQRALEIDPELYEARALFEQWRVAIQQKLAGE